MPVREKVVSASLMDRHRHLRLKGFGSKTARRGIGKMKMVRADVITTSFSQMNRFGGRRNKGQFGKIELRSAKGIRGQKIVDRVAVDSHVVGVERANINIGQAVIGQFANP